MHFIAFLCDYAQWQFSAISEVICLSMFSYIFLHTSCSIAFLETHLSRVGSRWYFCVSVQIVDPISALRPFQPQRSLALSSVPMKKADALPMSQSQEYNSYHLIESYSTYSTFFHIVFHIFFHILSLVRCYSMQPFLCRMDQRQRKLI